MKKTIYISTVVLLAMVSTAAADTINVESKITDVTVYADRALVTRQATVRLKPGTHNLVATDLAGGLRDKSIRGWGEGSARVKMLGMTVGRQELPRPSDERIVQLEDEVRRLDRELNRVSQESKVIDSEVNYIENLTSNFVKLFNEGILTGTSPAVKLAETIRLIDDRLAKLIGRRMDLIKEERELKKQRDKVREELDKARYPGQTENKTLTVEIECVSAGSFDLSFSYIMMNAGWYPVYDLRANSDSAKVTVVSKAKVRQQTGEDWRQVNLTLSSATPQVSGDMPEPGPIIVDLAPEVRDERKSKGLFSGGKADAAPPMAPSPAPPPPPGPEGVTISTAQVISGETAVEFKIERPRTIDSDGKPHLVPIGSNTFKGRFQHLTIPIESPYAYLIAKVKNDSNRAFPAGEASVFFGGKFVGKVNMPDWALDEEIEMPLGVDEGIEVERKIIEKNRDTSFGRVTIDYLWKIEITNNRTQSARIDVYEPIPKSRHEDIDVKVGDISPEPVKTGDDGKAFWEIDLKPGEKAVISVSYRIRYPSDRRVENLP